MNICGWNTSLYRLKQTIIQIRGCQPVISYYEYSESEGGIPERTCGDGVGPCQVTVAVLTDSW